MHLPPAAQVCIGRSGSHLCFLVLWATVYAGFLLAGYGSFTPLALAGLATAFALVWVHAAWRWWTGPTGMLAWTGREWIWQQAQEKRICSVRWRVDLQAIVLLELQMHERPFRSLWVERDALSTASWTAFRRALAGASEPWIAADDEKTDFSAANYLSPSQPPHIQIGPN